MNGAQNNLFLANVTAKLLKFLLPILLKEEKVKRTGNFIFPQYNPR